MPCPFCGGSDLTFDENAAVILCNRCGAEGPVGESDEHAESLWNQRVFSVSQAAGQYRVNPDK